MSKVGLKATIDDEGNIEFHSFVIDPNDGNWNEKGLMYLTDHELTLLCRLNYKILYGKKSHCPYDEED